MASTYALPVSPLPHSANSHYRQHSHGGHTHSHTRSSSPSKLAPAGARSAYTPKTPLNGAMHSHSHSRSQSGHLPNLDLSLNRHKVSPVHEDSYAGDKPSENEGADSSYPNNHLASPIYSEFTGVNVSDAAEDQPHKGHVHHGHSHDGHECHGHHPKAAEPRSKFTNFMIQRTLNFPLLQSILVEKDSRRIFYFMR